MLYAINSSLCFNCHLFEANPNQNGATDMISNASGFAALISFNTCQLLGFSVKLLNLPAKAAHIMYDLHVGLGHLVSNDIIRALGRQHYSENFHLMIGGKTFNFDDLALLPLCFGPIQTIHALVRFCSTRIIYLAIIFERTIVDFAKSSI